MEELIPNYHDFYCFYNNSHVISIYHTAYCQFFTNENMKVIGNILGYALDNPSECINQKLLESYLSKKINDFNDRKKQIKPDNILNSKIEDFFKRDVRKDTIDNKWYKISPILEFKLHLLVAAKLLFKTINIQMELIIFKTRSIIKTL